METVVTVHLILGLLLLTGLLCGLFAVRIGIPRVAAYVVAGVLFSDSLFGTALGAGNEDWAEPVTAFALAIIAYLIGGSISIADLRRSGAVILSTVAAQTLFAALLVSTLLYLLLPPELYGVSAAKLALAFGAIAVTTAPAATIAVLHQYRAQGPVTTVLLGVVALDDAVGVVLFAVMLAFVSGISLSTTLAAALVEIGGALLLGAIAGYGLSRAARKVHQGSLRLPLVITAIMLALGLSERWGFSPLLATMTLGFASRFFLGAAGDRLIAPIEYFEEMVFLLFFTVAGTHFDASVFVDYSGLILCYFGIRLLGKVLGAAVGAKLAHAPQAVVRWVGLGLAPQAGVAVGLALTLSSNATFAAASGMILNVILGTTLLNELLGPSLVKIALKQSGELSLKPKRKRL